MFQERCLATVIDAVIDDRNMRCVSYIYMSLLCTIRPTYVVHTMRSVKKCTHVNDIPKAKKATIS